MNEFGPLLPGGGHEHRFDPRPHICQEALAGGLTHRPSLLEEAQHLEIVRRVGETYRAMKADQRGLDATWLPAGEWAVSVGSRSPLHAALLAGSHEAALGLLQSFWRNALGPIVKEYATYESLTGGDPEQARRFMHNVVRNWLIWRELSRQSTSMLETPPVGDPWGYLIDGTLVAPKATRYHLVARELAGMVGHLERPVVIEIGAGYGGLGDFLSRSLPEASWLDYDLPETAVIAAYFHLCARGGKRVCLYGEHPTPRCRADLRAGVSHILPNYALRALEPRTADATVNMFSLSEVGPEPLAAYCRRIEVVTEGWFLHHNMDRAGVVHRGHERIPASSFTIDHSELALVSTGFDPFHGLAGDYRWFLYRRSSRR